MALLLITPEQHAFQDPTLELDEARLTKWLASLPVLNAGESLRMILRALEPLNEQRLAVDKRLRLLGIYRLTTQRLYITSDPLHLRQQPLSRQQRQDTVDDVERLCLAMANGFKIMVKELHDAGTPDQDPALFGQVLFGAVQQLAAALLHSYRFYRPEPSYVFLELNQLYRLGRHYGVLEQRDGGEDVDGGNSLAGVYQASCLLALTDPFSIEEGQADRYYRTLLAYTQNARIIPGNSWQGVPEGLYSIDLQSDSRPRHCVFLDSPVPGDEPYILDARAVLQAMHQALAALPVDRRKQRSEAGILRALLPEVTPRDKRRSERTAAGRWIDVVVGLEGICDWLVQHGAGKPPEAARWQIKDISEQGYRLAWGESAASVLQVGDLICVVADSGQSSPGFQLLVVRWLCDERDQGTELGVEKLEGLPQPVRLAGSQDRNAETCQALFLPSTGLQGSVARLVAPSELYEEQRPLVIDTGGRKVPVRCGERVEEGAGFACFEFLSGA